MLGTTFSDVHSEIMSLKRAIADAVISISNRVDKAIRPEPSESSFPQSFTFESSGSESDGHCDTPPNACSPMSSSEKIPKFSNLTVSGPRVRRKPSWMQVGIYTHALCEWLTRYYSRAMNLSRRQTWTAALSANRGSTLPLLFSPLVKRVFMRSELTGNFPPVLRAIRWIKDIISSRNFLTKRQYVM